MLSYYKYWLIFPIMVLEGPIITVISGFLVSLGTLNAFVAYPLLFFGDLLGAALGMKTNVVKVPRRRTR